MSDLLNEASLVLIPSGTKASKVYAQIPEDGSGDMTFSRASDATRVNSLGLVEKVRTNLLSYSQDFSNSYWYKNQVTVTANDTTAPDGTLTADKISASTTTGNYINEQTGFNLVCNRSIYAKAGNYSQITILWNSYNNGMYATFDLSNGTVSYGGSGITATIESVGNGWYRCATNGAANYPYLVTLNGVSNNSISIGSYVYIWGAQLEVSDFGPTAYIPTTSTAVSVGPYSNIPRLNYKNGGGGCPSLLLEAQRTNEALYSEQFDNSAWTKTAVTITDNNAISPDGYQDADGVIEDTTSSSGRRVLPTLPFTGTGGAYYSLSVYVKKIPNQPTRHIYWMCQFGVNAVYAHFNMTTFAVNEVTSSGNGSNASASITSVGNDWYRITLSGIISSSSGDYYNQFYFEDTVRTGFTPQTYTGNGTSGFYLWGWQLEAGSYPSSYIPTLGTSVTRVADECYKTGISSLIGQTEGAIYVEFNSQYLESYTQRLLTLSDGTTNNVIGLQVTAANQITFYVEYGGANQVAITKSSPAFTLGQKVKIGVAYKANDFVLYVDGVQVGTDSSGSVPTTSALKFSEANDFAYYRGQINEVVLFPTRLTNSQLAELTA